MSVNKVIFFKSLEAREANPQNKPGDFTVRFTPELFLEPNRQHYIALDHISMTASWYNIRPEYNNNKLSISRDKGVNFEEIIFPSGVYDYDDLNDLIQTKIGKLGDTDEYGINILFDFSTYKVLIKLHDDYKIDFGASGTFNELLGFKKELLESSAFGANLPNITNSIDNIYLRCSWVNNSIVNGKSTGVLFTFPTNTKVRSLPFVEYPLREYLWTQIGSHTISEVRFWMTDDKNRIIDLNGIDDSLAIVIKTL